MYVTSFLNWRGCNKIKIHLLISAKNDVCQEDILWYFPGLGVTGGRPVSHTAFLCKCPSLALDTIG